MNYYIDEIFYIKNMKQQLHATPFYEISKNKKNPCKILKEFKRKTLKDFLVTETFFFYT